MFYKVCVPGLNNICSCLSERVDSLCLNSKELLNTISLFFFSFFYRGFGKQGFQCQGKEKRTEIWFFCVTLTVCSVQFLLFIFAFTI